MTLQNAAMLDHQPTTDAEVIDELARQYFAISDFEGFIQHPSNVPITISRARNNELLMHYDQAQDETICSGIGLCFEAQRYYSPGDYLKLSIETPKQEQIFYARVVLVKNQDASFLLGVWFDKKTDASRIRELQQMCHLENYLREKRCQDGPYLSQNIVARQWVDQFSHVFPSI